MTPRVKAPVVAQPFEAGDVRVSPIHDNGGDIAVTYKDGDLVQVLRFRDAKSAQAVRANLMAQPHRFGQSFPQWESGWLRCQCGWKVRVAKKDHPELLADGHVHVESIEERLEVLRFLRSAR